MRWQWGTLPALVLAWTMTARVEAAATLTQLTTANIDQLIPHWKTMGIRAGDVLLENSSVRVAVLAGLRELPEHQAGQCVLLSTDSTVSTALAHFTPGPAGIWQKAEAGRAGTDAIIRFRAKESNWSAELTYSLDEASPWLTVATTYRNTAPEETLEAPIVDRLQLGSQAKAEMDRGGIWLATGAGMAAGWMPLQQRPTAGTDTKNNVWYLGCDSGDPETSVFKKASLRVLRLGRSPEHKFQPVAADSDWHKSARDNSSWYRLAPGTERMVQRRLLFAPTRQEVLALAMGKAESLAAPVRMAARKPAVTEKEESLAKATPPAAVATKNAPSGFGRLFSRQHDEQPVASAPPASSTRAVAGPNKPAPTAPVPAPLPPAWTAVDPLASVPTPSSKANEPLALVPTPTTTENGLPKATVVTEKAGSASVSPAADPMASLSFSPVGENPAPAPAREPAVREAMGTPAAPARLPTQPSSFERVPARFTPTIDAIGELPPPTE